MGPQLGIGVLRRFQPRGLTEASAFRVLTLIGPFTIPSMSGFLNVTMSNYFARMTQSADQDFIQVWRQQYAPSMRTSSNKVGDKR
jgi:hypothetical protein